MAGPLEGIRVLDFTIAQQGPYAALLLAEMGAEVIKVEEPGRGDLARALARDRRTKFSYYFLALNRSKKGIAINLKHPKGRQLILDLARHCDVVVENFRPGVMEKLGLGYEDLRQVNPRIIYARATAFGTRGPWGHRRGNDITVQASSGIMSVTGLESDPPLPVGVAIADHIGGLTLAVGILAALMARERTGVGQKVETSLLGSMVAAQSPELTYRLATGQKLGRAGLGHTLLPHLWRVYRTADGYMAIGGVPPERWRDFCQAIGWPELADDPRFREVGERLRRISELNNLLDEHFSRLPAQEWVARLEEADLPVARVYDYDALIQEPHLYENDYLVPFSHRRLGEITLVNCPIHFSETPAAIKGPEPELGEHTQEVLSRLLGLSQEEIESLRQEGVI
jgi:crotonobetainyl-CoA:carnitine CoA-transferase CaiB-like acyl-CoA transferase